HPLQRARPERRPRRSGSAPVARGRDPDPAPLGQRGQLVGVGDEVDLDDAVAGDREAEDGDRPVARDDDQAGGSVHDGGAREAREPRRASQDLLGDGGCAGDDRRHVPGAPATVGPEDDVRVEHGDERFEVSAPRRGEERVDDPPLPPDVRLLGRRRTPDAAAGPAGELAGGGGTALDDRSGAGGARPPARRPRPRSKSRACGRPRPAGGRGAARTRSFADPCLPRSHPRFRIRHGRDGARPSDVTGGLALIEVEKLSKVYPGGVEAVKEIDFDVAPGEVFGLLGPNGAGKSTTIGMLTTTVRPTSGRARLAGFDVRTEPLAARKVSSVVFQEAVVDRSLTGRQNLDLHARLWGVEPRSGRKRIDALVAVVGLRDLVDRPVATYSG